MRLTPIEIRQHRFNVRLRGFDAHEVEAFLETVVSDFEDVVRENAQLRREIERLARELQAYQGRERNIQETLTTAQGIVEELKRTAMKEAEVLVSEAKLRGEKLLLENSIRATSTYGVAVSGKPALCVRNVAAAALRISKLLSCKGIRSRVCNIGSISA